jgi:hypothetical protein
MENSQSKFEKLRKINSEGDLVPFQSLSSDIQKRYIEKYGHPYGVQQRDKSAAGKNPSGTGTVAEVCRNDEKLQLPPATVKVLCQTCRGSLISISSDQPVNSHLIENKPSLRCFYDLIEKMNQLRRERGGPRISHNQVRKWMQDVSKFQEDHPDICLPAVLRHSKLQHSAANV